MVRYLCLLCFFLASCGSEKNNEQIFDSLLDSYVSAFNNRDFDKVFSFLPSQAFETFSKKQMINYYLEVESTIGPTTIEEYEFIKRGRILEKGDSSFRKMTYRYTTFNHREDRASSPDIILTLKNSYGKENVQYDSIENIIIIHQTKDLVFVKSMELDWFFIEYDSTKENSIIKKIVPSLVLSEL